MKALANHPPKGNSSETVWCVILDRPSTDVYEMISNQKCCLGDDYTYQRDTQQTKLRARQFLGRYFLLYWARSRVCDGICDADLTAAYP